jgi:hypothetical protein
VELWKKKDGSKALKVQYCPIGITLVSPLTENGQRRKATMQVFAYVETDVQLWFEDRVCSWTTRRIWVLPGAEPMIIVSDDMLIEHGVDVSHLVYLGGKPHGQPELEGSATQQTKQQVMLRTFVDHGVDINQLIYKCCEDSLQGERAIAGSANINSISVSPDYKFRAQLDGMKEEEEELDSGDHDQGAVDEAVRAQLSSARACNPDLLDAEFDQLEKLYLEFKDVMQLTRGMTWSPRHYWSYVMISAYIPYYG